MLQPNPHVHGSDAPLEHGELIQVEEEVDKVEQHSSQPAKEGAATGKQVAQPGLRRTRLKKKLRNFGLGVLFLAPALLVFAIFTYFPLFRAFWLSLNITNELGDPVRFVGLRYYANVLNLDGISDEYVQSLLTSFKFVSAVVILQIMCGLALASLAMAKVQGIGIFRLLYTISLAVSLASSSVIWSIIFDPSTNVTTWLTDLLRLPQPGLLNNASTALTAVIIASVWSGLGFNFVITLAGMQAIPEELYESAALDGAGGWNKFIYITLPMLTPILLFLLVVNTIGSFQAFTQFNVLEQGPGPNNSTNVFVYAIYQSFWIDHRYGFASAMSIILFLILLILSAIQFFAVGKRVHYR
jgi:sn-glycerol 3-phosphate transport system permease protein